MNRYIILIVSLFAMSCSQYYEPEIDADGSIITIHGLLTNQSGGISVTISKAIPFDTVSVFTYDDNATVTITDDAGGNFTLSNTGKGVYSNGNFTGVAGRTYTLHVITSAGDEYVSEPQTMPEVYTLDSLYGDNVTKDVKIETADNTYFYTTKTGVEFYSDLGSPSGNMPRCRFESQVTVLYYYVINDNTPDAKNVYGWKSFNPNAIPNVTTSKFTTTKNVVKEHNLCFFVNKLTEYIDTTEAYATGWLYTLSKYNLNAESQTYYQEIVDQMEASDKLFDPLPSQLPSNISCVNNPDKEVIGFFEVSSMEKRYYRCSLGTKIGFTEKDNFPGFTYTGETEGTPPPFFY